MTSKVSDAMIEAGAEVFRRHHRDTCYPDAMQGEQERAAMAIYLDMKAKEEAADQSPADEVERVITAIVPLLDVPGMPDPHAIAVAALSAMRQPPAPCEGAMREMKDAIVVAVGALRDGGFDDVANEVEFAIRDYDTLSAMHQVRPTASPRNAEELLASDPDLAMRVGYERQILAAQCDAQRRVNEILAWLKTCIRQARYTPDVIDHKAADTMENIAKYLEEAFADYGDDSAIAAMRASDNELRELLKTALDEHDSHNGESHDLAHWSFQAHVALAALDTTKGGGE